MGLLSAGGFFGLDWQIADVCEPPLGRLRADRGPYGRGVGGGVARGIVVVLAATVFENQRDGSREDDSQNDHRGCQNSCRHFPGILGTPFLVNTRSKLK